MNWGDLDRSVNQRTTSGYGALAAAPSTVDKRGWSVAARAMSATVSAPPT